MGADQSNGEAKGQSSEACAMEACAVEGCGRRRYARRLCQAHYKRQRRHGDVFADLAVGAPRAPSCCTVPACDRAAEARGWCHEHYQRWLRAGDVQADVPLSERKQPQTCTVEGCVRTRHAKGLCGTHYKRAVKHGEIDERTPIRVVTGEGGLSHGYWKIPVPPELRHLTNGERTVAEHRLVMALHLGRPLRTDEVVHHKNGDRRDNRIENLELWCTYQPKGQRADDKVAYAVEILRRYRPDLLARDVENRTGATQGGKSSPDRI